jgi:hypothetical protein
MIHNDAELNARQERIRLFENVLAEARRTYATPEYRAMAEGYLLEIEKMRAEILEYLSHSAQQVEAA